MKQIKNAVCLCLCLLLAASLMGCGSRTAVTEETFTSVMESMDADEQIMDEASIASAKASGVDTYRVYITTAGGSAAYCLYTSVDSARTAYASMISAMAQQKVTKTKELDSATYNRIEFVSDDGDGGALTIIRTDTTLLTVSDSEANVKDILSKLGI